MSVIFLNPNPILRSSIAKLIISFSTMSSSSSKIIAEYAKSNRSSCKKCSTSIDNKSLRLGSVSRDPRGFDSTKWYHLNCLPLTSTSVDSISGFTSLKTTDQAALKSLIEATHEKVIDGDKDTVKDRKRKISEVTKDDDEEKKDTRKVSPPYEAPNMKLRFSVFDILDKYMDATLLPKWKAFQTIIFLEGDDGLHHSSKIAAFDFDQCLAKTSLRRVGSDAWSLMYPSIPEKLQSLYNDGYKLVIFTNESNIDRWKNKRQIAVDSKIGRLSNFIKKVGVPMQVFIACGIGKSGNKAGDPFRKPETGMWRIMEQHFNSGIPVDMDQSFYVGDAAGRPDDHSDADIKFAEAIGLKFYVPEDYFQ
ncbi:polynucleotide 3'-phosphatase ZDP [Daucus carota subsp. sativus]|uniref:polynucleotide 3'-phosphatase ZDP n=1 Tax=Daucus carota subsp. sativus TaxID=79200 RepID=UPI0007F00314|nr:PREDICTED: polynucleotide 3'-phosphatase ZDP [Daucus carota subsp. sativus]